MTDEGHLANISFRFASKENKTCYICGKAASKYQFPCCKRYYCTVTCFQKHDLGNCEFAIERRKKDRELYPPLPDSEDEEYIFVQSRSNFNVNFEF